MSNKVFPVCVMSAGLLRRMKFYNGKSTSEARACPAPFLWFGGSAFKLIKLDTVDRPA